ncbi:hypothetical protein M0R45_023134 [Rubus argutus]|uniref:Uncharacterized protein n=1 Tax=Rubus argutus TaxID=59490 RepID=A0AAW1WNM9_RUBAR
MQKTKIKVTLSNFRFSKVLKEAALNSDKPSLSATASLASPSAAAFLAAQSSLLRKFTKQGTKFLKAP